MRSDCAIPESPAGGTARGTGPARVDLHQLIAAVTVTGKPPGASARPVRTGWGAIDGALGGGGLARGVVHEWFGAGWGQRPCWQVPVRVLSHLALATQDGDARGLIVWIGAGCFAYPLALLRGKDRARPDRTQLDRTILERSVLVAARTVEERAWAIDVSLRCAGVDAVIADASGTRMTESRRFQLAAAAGGTLALLARPPWEERELSAAATRWRVTPGVGDGAGGDVAGWDVACPGWTLELLRCKGTRPLAEDARRWAVRVDDETGDVRLVSDAGDRCAASEGPAWTTPERVAGGVTRRIA